MWPRASTTKCRVHLSLLIIGFRLTFRPARYYRYQNMNYRQFPFPFLVNVYSFRFLQSYAQFSNQQVADTPPLFNEFSKVRFWQNVLPDDKRLVIDLFLRRHSQLSPAPCSPLQSKFLLTEMFPFSVGTEPAVVWTQGNRASFGPVTANDC